MILIADDSKFMRHYFIQALREHGYTNFIEASNGREAVLFHILFEPSVTLLDIKMPEVDGLTALKKIKKANPAAQVIMCSSLATKENRQEAKMLGASDFIVKPFFGKLGDKVIKLRKSNGGKYVERING